MRSYTRKTILISAGAAVCILALGLALIVARWPFTKAGSVERLQHLMGATVEVRSFRSTYFPYAGYVAEGVTFRKQLSPGAPAQPFATVTRLTVQTSYFELFQKPHRLNTVLAEGVHMIIPSGGINLTSQKSGKSEPVVVGELRFEQAILDVAASTHDSGPLRFAIHTARFLNVGPDKTVAFSTSLRIPEPPGEVETKGWIGPWRDNRGTIRSTPITGWYVLRGANLGHYRSLMGVVASDGEFSGTLAKLAVKGSTSSPDFGVRESGHHFRVNTRFAGTVDVVDGDVVVSSLQAELGKTALDATARVAGHPKVVELNVTRGKGEVQDLMLLFSDAPRSPITGPITFTTKTSLKPGDRPFKERVQLAGEFNIDPARFTAPDTQSGVDKLSAEAQGEHSQLAEDNEVVSDLHGTVVLENGIARMPHVTFSVPGATANLAGTYSLLNKRVKFDGKMRMQAKLSEATTGAKSMFLKILDPFFKKKGAGAELPVEMAGIYGKTHFSVGLRDKK